MACLNINSLLSHIDEVRAFIEGTRIDILALNETKLDQSIKDNELYLPGYEIIKKDRTRNSRNSGGVCIYIRSNLNFRIHEDLNVEQLEITAIFG